MTTSLSSSNIFDSNIIVPVIEADEQVASTPFEEFGCDVNAIDVEDLFDRYGEAGFLYPEKLEKLRSFLPQIMENWRKAMEAGDAIHRVVTHEDAEAGSWASISSWRTTVSGWSTQHLVSCGSPLGSRAVMLAEQKAEAQDCEHKSNQNWFRPTNRMPKRIFGSIVDSLGEENAAVECFNYVEVTPLAGTTCPTGVRVVECTPATQAALVDLAVETRGEVYVEAEELRGDLNLHELDQAYQEVGLRRYRRVWLAQDETSGETLAALIAYRGPLGFNFSFLESRADLLVSDQVDDEQMGEIVSSLIAAAKEEYADFEPGFIPVIADDRAARVLELRGDRIVRQYCQSIWLEGGYEDWYQHTESFYSRIMKRLARRVTATA